MPAAASPFAPVAQSDEIRSTSCTEEEALHVRETPAKVRGVWKVSVVATVTGLIAAASAWWSHSESAGDEITGLASTFYSYGTIGCWNWADIEISRSQVADQNECATLCTNNPECTMYNWQKNACEPGWPVARGCLLFRGTCTTMRNDCWQLDYKIQSTETFFAQTLTVETSVGRAEAEAAVVAALAAVGIEAKTNAVATGRRLQDQQQPGVLIITWFYYYADAATWQHAFQWGRRLLMTPLLWLEFTASCKDHLPDGSTFGVVNVGEPVTAGLSEIIVFNCSDNTTSMLELESCHDTKVGVLRQQMGDLPPEVKENEGAFSDFLLANHRDYFGGSSVNATEYKARLEVFSATMKLVEERNAAASKSGLSNPARHGVTKYADWTLEEFAALLGGQGPSGERGGTWVEQHPESEETRSLLEEAPGNASCSADWSGRTQMGNQGQCGNCWAFSTADSIRSATIQQTGQDPGPLSNQYITDCMTITSCNGGRAVNGCCGGNPGRAMLWLEEVQKEGGGIPTQEAYGDIYKPGELLPSGPEAPQASNMLEGPVSEDGNGITYSGNFPYKKFPCKTGIPPAVKLVSGGAVLKTEAEMESYVCGTGSLSIVVDGSTWQTYVGGVIDAKSCGTKANHAPLLVGLNQEENAWLVQNSWGYDWGINTAGQTSPRDEFSGCPLVAGKDKKGCAIRLTNASGRGRGKTLADVCKWSCSDEPTKDFVKGGFAWLQFGTNACAIRTEPIIVPYVNVSIV